MDTARELGPDVYKLLENGETDMLEVARAQAGALLMIAHALVDIADSLRYVVEAVDGEADPEES